MTLILTGYEKAKDLLMRVLAFLLGMWLCSIAPLKLNAWPYYVAPTWRYWILFICLIGLLFLNLYNERAFKKQEDSENLKRVQHLSCLGVVFLGFMSWPILCHV